MKDLTKEERDFIKDLCDDFYKESENQIAKRSMVLFETEDMKLCKSILKKIRNKIIKKSNKS